MKKRTLFFLGIFIFCHVFHVRAQNNCWRPIVFKNAYNKVIYDYLVSTVKGICDLMPDNEKCISVFREGKNVILKTNVPMFFKSVGFLAPMGILGLLLAVTVLIRLCECFEVRCLKRSPHSTFADNLVMWISNFFRTIDEITVYGVRQKCLQRAKCV